jgi:F-type H+-transporting ATPase subunit beta
MAKNLVGKITQVMGPVIDVQFSGDLPAILNALTTENEGKRLVLEVARYPTPASRSRCRWGPEPWGAS